jgi:NAD(P)-dependent dehydrogenase (short-subunit alcohol dehydrogenase family)
MDTLEGKKYLVVGGSSGIGLALTGMLAERGATVHAWSRRDNPELPQGDVIYSQVDVTAPLEEAGPAALPESLDGLAYCPGSIDLKPFPRLSPDQFRSDFEINLIGAVRVLQYAEKALRAGEGGSVVLFSTVAVRTGMAYHASIAAAKGAVEGLVRSLAAEYAGKKLRVNGIAPSATDTPLAAAVLGNEKKRQASAERHPLQRVGTAEDMAAAALYLLGPGSDWITGQILPVDGGISALR